MPGCPELRRLPKARTSISSLHFRNQTPGSAADVFAKTLRRNRDDRLDPGHPIYYASGKQEPIITAARTTSFTLRAIPLGLLSKPTNPNRPVEPFDTWDARVSRGAPTGTVAPMLLHDPRPNRLGMSLQFSTVSDFRTHQRTQILSRFKTALGLIVVRNADVRQVNGRQKLVFEEGGAKPEEWILQGWTYHVRPTLELYRMPYPELVGILRPMLRDIWDRGMKLEEEWTTASLAKFKTGSPSPSVQPSAKRSRPDRVAPDTSETPGDDNPDLASTRATPLKRRPTSVASVASLPPVPDFDPFPSTPVPPAPTPPSLLPKLINNKSSKPVNWWAVGRVLEAAVADGDYQGPTRWNPAPRAAPLPERSQDSVPTQAASPPAAAPAPDPSRASVQTKLAGMLYRPQSVIRPDQKERAAGQIPRRMNQFEDN